MAETTNSMISNEGLAIEIKNLSVQIADLKAVIAQNATDYIRKEVFELKMKEIELQIQSNKTAIAKLENRKTLINWLLPTLSAASSAILTYLIIEVLNK